MNIINEEEFRNYEIFDKRKSFKEIIKEKFKRLVKTEFHYVSDPLTHRIKANTYSDGSVTLYLEALFANEYKTNNYFDYINKRIENKTIAVINSIIQTNKKITLFKNGLSEKKFDKFFQQLYKQSNPLYVNMPSSIVFNCMREVKHERGVARAYPDFYTVMEYKRYTTNPEVYLKHRKLILKETQ